MYFFFDESTRYKGCIPDIQLASPQKVVSDWVITFLWGGPAPSRKRSRSLLITSRPAKPNEKRP